ncbi:MAG: hypothetical protein ACI9WC_003746 [Arenicella sp.]|jgi:hypothetical protein
MKRKAGLLERIFDKFWTIPWTSLHADKEYEVETQGARIYHINRFNYPAITPTPRKFIT